MNLLTSSSKHPVRLLLGLSGLAFFVLSPSLWSRLSPQQYEGARSRNLKDRHTRNASAIAVMLGEFRTGISDILLVKTERYLHSGVGYMPHIGKEVQGAMGRIESFDAHQEEVGEIEEHHHHDGCDED